MFPERHPCILLVVFVYFQARRGAPFHHAYCAFSEELVQLQKPKSQACPFHANSEPKPSFRLSFSRRSSLASPPRAAPPVQQQVYAPFRAGESIDAQVIYPVIQTQSEVRSTAKVYMTNPSKNKQEYPETARPRHYSLHSRGRTLVALQRQTANANMRVR